MAIHNLLDALKRMDMENDGAIMNVPGVGYILAWGTTVPVDGTSFYAPGCVFIHTDGTGEDVFSVNQGTYDSCSFKGFETALEAALAAITNGNGASKIGVEDSAGKITGINVETALAEIALWKTNTALTTAGNGASLIGIQDAANKITGVNIETALAEIALWKSTTDPNIPIQIADPGTGVAIPVTASGNCSVTIGSAGAETNTLAIPTFVGQRISFSVTAVGTGTRKVTAASAINKAGNVSITIAAAGDSIELVGMKVDAALAWRVVVNDGCTLGA